MARGTQKEPAVPASEEKPSPRRSKKKILLLAFLGLFLALGGFATYVWVSDDSPASGKEVQAASPSTKDKVTMPLEPFLVNLGDKDTRRYLKLKLELEVNSEKDVKELEKSLPRVRDALILLLSSKSYLDLATAEGKQHLKKEIITRITALPTGKKVSDVFFTEFVAQ